MKKDPTADEFMLKNEAEAIAITRMKKAKKEYGL